MGTILISSFFIYKNNKEEKKQEGIFEELIEISKDTEQESENGELNDTKNDNEHKQVIENVKIDKSSSFKFCNFLDMVIKIHSTLHSNIALIPILSIKALEKQVELIKLVLF